MMIQTKFATTRSELASSLIEREQEIDLALTALIAQEHVLLVGPPGCGKSLLADTLVSWMNGSRFSILMTKFTTPEELCGPISIAGLKADTYRRITTGKLPEAEICLLDEIWKSSSAILNTILTILNERIYRNNGTVIQCPLKLCIAASNEWPGGDDGKELGALFDRFLFRKSVRPIATDKGIDQLLWKSNHTPVLSTSITSAEIDQAASDAMSLAWERDSKEAFLSVLKESRREGIIPGDRRLHKAVKAVQAFAYLQGGTSVEPDHLEVLSHVLWEDPTEQPKKVAEIVGRIANPTGMQINSLLMEAEEVVRGANLSDLGQAASATRKLNEIVKKLKDVPGSRAKQAQDHVAEEVRRIKRATIDAM
jgi:MoxR-like ATPase